MFFLDLGTNTTNASSLLLFPSRKTWFITSGQTIRF